MWRACSSVGQSRGLIKDVVKRHCAPTKNASVVKSRVLSDSKPKVGTIPKVSQMSQWYVMKPRHWRNDATERRMVNLLEVGER